MTILLIFISCVLGFIFLALSMNHHYRQVTNRGLNPITSQWLRILGVLGLVVSFTLCILSAGVGSGIVLWFGVATAAVLGVVFILSYCPALIRVLVR